MAGFENINTFEQLLRYLEQELDWPIDEMEIDDLTFDYDPEEDLGLDPKTAAKIKYIKQLRPLDGVQPFGIFFVEFDRKTLPVVAMRRILGRLVTKRRESANPADRKTWNQDDLLFISAYGETETRRLDFAHFADDAQNGLPTLRVLGWDADDTDRKLGWVERQLRDHLLWPDDATPDEWRIQWRSAFTLRNREVITTSKALAAALAELAKKIRARVLAAIALESPKGPLRKLHQAFQDSLIHDLDHAGFADMYAQTIAYGLLSARMSRPAGLVADDAALMIPNTNPFLRELMEEFLRIGGRHKQAPGAVGIDFDELGVNEVVDLLREANIEAVIADFGREKPGEDPVIHFYEYFMTVYDKKQKVSRGVFYTPRPVVSFIVRSVDEILRTEFGLPLGLADTTTWGEMAERFNSSATPSEPGRVGEADAGASASLSRPRRERAGERAPSPTPSPPSASDPRPFTIPDTVKPTDPFVQILDPATGTGTFLVEVIDLIHARMVEHWREQGKTAAQIDRLWNEYVPDHLLPRLYGFELMMAPYAIAHMKIGLKLVDTGYRFQSEQRLRVFLTNSLEPPTDLSEMLEFVAPFLAHEARAAASIKRALRATVVVGNPPYSYMSANMTAAARELVNEYRSIAGEIIRERGAIVFERALQDDYVKFIGLGGSLLARTGYGVLGYISNGAFLDNPNLRGMRWSLTHSYTKCAFLNLHGDQKRDGGDDGNVFDIITGVAISLLRRSLGGSESQIALTDLRGSTACKYTALLEDTIRTMKSATLAPRLPLYLFVYSDNASSEYFDWPTPESIFERTSVAIKTNRDDFVIDTDPKSLLGRIRVFIDPKRTDTEIVAECSLNENSQWELAPARRACRAAFSRDLVRELHYRPFDRRLIYYDPSVVFNDRPSTMKPMLEPGNLALLSVRRVRTGRHAHFFVASGLHMAEMLSSADNCNTYPLWGERVFERSPRPLLLRKPYREMLQQHLGWKLDGTNEAVPSPETVFYLIYAIVHSPTYRERYQEYLLQDYPRIPVPRNHALGEGLARLGADLVALHLQEAELPAASWRVPHTTKRNPFNEPITTFHDEGDREVLKVGEKGKAMAESPMGDGLGRVYINDTAYFDGVPEAVWNFHIGGYQVCHKWLSDRKGVAGGKNPHPGRTLTDEDIAHYHRIVIALNETIRLMGEIDEVIEEHGGWPGAFVTGQNE